MDGKQLLPPDSPPHLRTPPHDNEDGPHPPPAPETAPSPQTAPAPKSGGSPIRPPSDDPSSKPIPSEAAPSPQTGPAPKSGGSPTRPTSDVPSSKPIPSEVQVEDINKVEDEYDANVFVFFHQMLYKAKVLYVTKYEGTIWRYYVAYEGFEKNDIWDEWVGYDRIVVRTKSNAKLKTKRQTEANQRKPKVFRPPEERNDPDNNKDDNGRWRDPVYAEKEIIDKNLGTAMPLSLYIRLLEDRDISLHVGKIVRLPHPYTVVEIVRCYKSHLEENKRPTQLVEKVLNRLIDDFDAKLRSKILFETEFDALKQITSNVDADCLPSQLYGIEHLLRWLAQLPKATFRGIIRERSLQILADFLTFLEERQNIFFLPKAAENRK